MNENGITRVTWYVRHIRQIILVINLSFLLEACWCEIERSRTRQALKNVATDLI